jgi:hypothetical protein
MLKGIFSICFLLFFTHLPIGAICEALKNLLGLCGLICDRNSLLDWGTMQIIVMYGVRRSHKKMLATITEHGMSPCNL